MITLDHIAFAVADYQRSKGFYEKSLAPLGLKLLMEDSARSDQANGLVQDPV